MKSLLIFLAPLVAVLGLCCAPKPPALPDGAGAPKPAAIEFHADTDFTKEEQGYLTEAAMAWNVQTGGAAKVTVVFDLDFGDVESLKRAMDQNTIARFTCDSDPTIEPGLLGQAPPWGGIHDPKGRHTRMLLCVDRFPNANYWKQVAIHEMGHALGLSHVMSPQALMYAAIIPNRTACLKQPDLAEFCRINVCAKPVYACE